MMAFFSKRLKLYVSKFYCQVLLDLQIKQAFDVSPSSARSFSTVLRHVSLGRPPLLYPLGA